MPPRASNFPLVFLTGMEEGLFPHSRTLTDPTQLEEERRLCYVGMTRAMDTLVTTRARYRRRYGNDMPEQSLPSRFLEEIPAHLLEDLGSPPARESYGGSFGNSYGSGYGGNRYGSNRLRQTPWRRRRRAPLQLRGRRPERERCRRFAAEAEDGSTVWLIGSQKGRFHR